MVVETTNFIFVLELKLSNNGGVDTAEGQMKAKQYAERLRKLTITTSSPTPYPTMQWVAHSSTKTVR